MTPDSKPATLWSGRFDSAPDAATFEWGASFGFDRRLFEDDVTGSLAWARALGGAGVLARAEVSAIESALQEILGRGRDDPGFVSGDDEDVEAVGIKADISSPVHLLYATDAAEPPRLLIMSGNTMGSFDPLAEIRYIAQCMKPEDRLIIDGEIFHEQESMARRDNPAVRRFLSALLASLGIADEDGEIGFNHKRDERHAGLHLITRYFRAERDITATVAGQQIPLQRGERIGLNFQYIYTPEAFEWLLRDQGGFDIIKQYNSPDGRFVTAVCRR